MFPLLQRAFGRPGSLRAPMSGVTEQDGANDGCRRLAFREAGASADPRDCPCLGTGLPVASGTRKVEAQLRAWMITRGAPMTCVLPHTLVSRPCASGRDWVEVVQPTVEWEGSSALSGFAERACSHQLQAQVLCRNQ